jgi:hypothetical protein
MTKNSKLWKVSFFHEKSLILKDVVVYLQSRATLNPNDIIGKVNTVFDYDRSRLITTIGNSANNIVSSYNRYFSIFFTR